MDLCLITLPDIILIGYKNVIFKTFSFNRSKQPMKFHIKQDLENYVHSINTFQMQFNIPRLSWIKCYCSINK